MWKKIKFNALTPALILLGGGAVGDLASRVSWEHYIAFLVWWGIVFFTLWCPLKSFSLLKYISNIYDIKHGEVIRSFIISVFSYYFSYEGSLISRTCTATQNSSGDTFSLFCATFPNIVAGVFVALAGAGALLYPIYQQQEKIRSRNRVLIAKMCQLSEDKKQVVLGATKLPHALLQMLVIPGTFLLALAAGLVYVAIFLSFKATIIAVSLTAFYLLIVIILVTTELIASTSEPDHDTTTTALSLLLSAAIKTPQNPLGTVVIHADSLELYQEVKSKLSSFTENAGTYAAGTERLYNFRLIDKVEYLDDNRTLTVYPFTGDKELSSKVLIGFKHLLHKHGTALNSKSSAVDETVLAMSRHALLKDCRLLVQTHLPNLLNSEQEALAIFLTLCGNSYINNPTKETIKKMPSTNQTVESLGIYFKLDADSCWYTLSEIDIYDKVDNCK